MSDGPPMLQRDAAVRLRRERWGGVAFHRATGDMLDLDGEGFAVLRALGDPSTLRALRGRVPSHLRTLASFVGALHARGFVRHVTADVPSLAVDSWADDAVPEHSTPLRAPLVAHWALTWRCNLQCAFCYTASGPWREHEPDAALRLRIVEALARWGVLEVALGGGEPTLVRDLPALLGAIRTAGMVPNITTNGVNLGDELLAAMAAHAGVVQVSADEPTSLDEARGDGVSRRVEATATKLRAAGVRFGVNLLLTPRHVRALRRALDAALTLGATGVTIVRPKAPMHTHGADFPTARDMAPMARALRAFMRERVPLRLSVDSALRAEWSAAGLLVDPEPEVLGCGGGQRHVALTPDGDVHPCSHARQSGYRMGNVVRDDRDALWERCVGRTRYLSDCDGPRCACRRTERIPVSLKLMAP